MSDSETKRRNYKPRETKVVGFKERQFRGMASVRAACNAFFAKRGMNCDISEGYEFGAQLRQANRAKREEARLDRIAEEMGATEI